MISKVILDLVLTLGSVIIFGGIILAILFIAGAIKLACKELFENE